VSRYQKGKTNLDFTEARDSEWQWNPLGHMQVCTLLQTDNHASTPPLSFLQAGCPSCRPANSVKALKANQDSCMIFLTNCLSKLSLSCAPLRSWEMLLGKLGRVGVMRVSNKCIAVRKVATPLRELTCHMGSHSVTCHPAEVTFPPFPRRSWYSIKRPRRDARLS